MDLHVESVILFTSPLGVDSGFCSKYQRTTRTSQRAGFEKYVTIAASLVSHNIS